MSIETLTSAAVELSSFTVSVAFADENGDAVTPDTVTWSLVNLGGRVINSRQDVEVASPAASIDIALNGDDLRVSGESASEQRLLIVRATYTASGGVSKNLNSAVLFSVLRLGILEA